MSKSTKIEWTEHTWNPVTGCTHVSPGCDHCYMYRMYPRLNAMGIKGYEKSPDVVQLLPERLKEPMKWKKPRIVFVCSMSDLFHRNVPMDYIRDIFQVMVKSSEENGHIFQVLTKRPGRAVAFWKEYSNSFNDVWPTNIWMGTSVENQKYAERLTVLNRLPAPVKFCSAEPLLESLNLTKWLEKGELQWLIVGGESGFNCREMKIEWANDLLQQSKACNVPFFLKQLGGVKDSRGGNKALINGQMYREMP